MEDTDEHNGTVLRWVVDVVPLWQLPPFPNSDRPLTHQWAPNRAVQATLDRLSQDERAKVLRFHFVADAKMSLASCLLKRRAISTICEIPWSRATVSEDSNRKPCYLPIEEGGKTLEFNVSHHGGIVAIVACEDKSTKLGVDVVSMNWNKDVEAVRTGGFEAWARTYEAVFSDSEVQDIINFEPEGRPSGQERIAEKIRHFYAHWCLKEAYVKMTEP